MRINDFVQQLLSFISFYKFTIFNVKSTHVSTNNITQKPK